MHGLRIDGVTKRFGAFTAVEDVRLTWTSMKAR